MGYTDIDSGEVVRYSNKDDAKSLIDAVLASVSYAFYFPFVKTEAYNGFEADMNIIANLCKIL